MRIIWDKHYDDSLTDLYNNGKSDAEIALVLNSTVYAVGKRRSIIGLCKFKKKKHTRAPKTVYEEPNLQNMLTGVYTKAGKVHYLNLGCDPAKALTVAKRVADRQLLRCITILHPKYKIQRNTGKVIEF